MVNNLHTIVNSSLSVNEQFYLYSFPKCGRTWLRYLFAYIFKEHLAAEHHINSQSNGKKIIVLIRDIRDVLVSYYFQVTKRTGFGSIDYAWKKHLGNQWDNSLSLSDFLRTGVINAFCEFYCNVFLIPDIIEIKYEDLLSSPFLQINKIVVQSDIKPSDEIINLAIQKCSFNNMHSLELNDLGIKGGIFKDGTWLPNLYTAVKNDNEALKTRKGIAGAYTEYLTSNDLDFIKKEINTKYHKIKHKIIFT